MQHKAGNNHFCQRLMMNQWQGQGVETSYLEDGMLFQQIQMQIVLETARDGFF